MTNPSTSRSTADPSTVRHEPRPVRPTVAGRPMNDPIVTPEDGGPVVTHHADLVARQPDSAPHSTRQTHETPLPKARMPREPIVIPDRVALRALRRFTLDPATGCHVSTYSVGSHGYAQIGWQADGRRTMVAAQRAAWVAVWQEIPAGDVISATCRNKRCVNPAHLRVMSNFEAARRTNGRDWPLGECAHGHPNSLLVQQPNGKWACGQCLAGWLWRHREYTRQWRRQRSRALADPVLTSGNDAQNGLGIPCPTTRKEP